MPYVIEVFNKLQKHHEIIFYFKNTNSGHELDNDENHYLDGNEVLKHARLGKLRINEIDLLLVSGFISWRYILLSWVARYMYGRDVVCISDKQIGDKLPRLKYWLYLSTFTYYWSAGEIQDRLARKKFKDNFRYISKFYSATDNYTKFVLPGVNKNSLKFLFLGRPIENKGFDLLMEVFRRQPALQLIVVGSRDDDLLPNVCFKGYLNQEEIVELVIKENLIGVLPSRYEPWGLVVHEMLSLGVPMICSKYVGAAQDLLVGELDELVLQDLTVEEIEARILHFSQLNISELDFLRSKCKLISKRLNSDLIVSNFNKQFG